MTGGKVHLEKIQGGERKGVGWVGKSVVVVGDYMVKIRRGDKSEVDYSDQHNCSIGHGKNVHDKR